MSSEDSNLKDALRRRVSARAKAISPGERQALSALALKRIQSQAPWMEAQSILAFAPLPDELDLWPLLASATASGKSVFLPKYDSTRGEYFACPVTAAATEMSPGRFGILEPPHPEACAPLNRLDLALVPGVAFDLHGHRLGRGKGFYDRLLKTMQARICGVAYDEQLVDHVPAQPHDVSMNFILTPSRWIQV